MADEEAAFHQEAVASLRLHDPLVEHTKQNEPFNCEPRQSMNPSTPLATPDLDLRYQHSKGAKPSISARSSDFTPFKHSECGENVLQAASSHDSPFVYGGFGYLLQYSREDT